MSDPLTPETALAMALRARLAGTKDGRIKSEVPGPTDAKNAKAIIAGLSLLGFEVRRKDGST